MKKVYSIDAYHGLPAFLRFTSAKDKVFNLEWVIGRDVCVFSTSTFKKIKRDSVVTKGSSSSLSLLLLLWLL